MVKGAIVFLALIAITSVCNAAETEKIEVKAEPSKTSRGALGQGFELHKIDLLTKQLQATGSRVFEDLPENECIEDSKPATITKDEKEYKNTENVYNSLATDNKIDGSLQSVFTLGASVEAVTNNIASEKTDIKGLSLNYKALSLSHTLKKECINKKPLSKDLVSDFEALDKEIRKPHLKQSWRGYSVFLEKYGSHIVKKSSSGSSIYQYVFSKATESYSQNDFHVKACVSLMGPTNVGVAKASLCSGVTKKKVEESSNFDMTKQLVVRGGKSDTRVDLTGDLSTEKINAFLKEAETDPSPIQYEFYPIWTILKARYIGTEHFAKAVNLEQFFKGYLSFDCTYEKSPEDQELQKFELDDDSDPQAPTYVCSLEPEGCHNDDDCEADNIIYCACCGPTCVRYNNTNVLSKEGGHKKIAFINDVDDQWRDKGCNKKNLKCKCTKESKKRGISWSGDSDSDEALRDVHYRLMDESKQNQAERRFRKAKQRKQIKKLKKN